MRPITLPLASLLLAATLPAVAQTHFCMGGDLDHLTPAEMTSCRAKMTDVREAVRRRGAPSGWHFMVVCDESGWQDVAALTGRDQAQLQLADYNTDRTLQMTFIRGSRLVEADSHVAGTLLNAALEGVPGRFARPGIDATPGPIPNVQRTVELPALQIADAGHLDGRGQDGTVSGQ